MVENNKAEANWTKSDIQYNITNVNTNLTYTVLDMDESILRMALLKDHLIDLGLNFDHITAVTK